MIFHPSNPAVGNALSGPDDFTRSFLFGARGIVKEGRRLRSLLHMDDKTQGWVGIPHGGVAMGAMADMAFALMEECEDSLNPCPFSLHYRMGGASAQLGDTLQAEMTATEAGAEGLLVKEQDAAPYLSATYRSADTDASLLEGFQAYLPTRIGDVENRMLPLPSYSNCFVCGIARWEPGLERRFYALDKPDRQRIVVSPVGCAGDGGEAFFRFQRRGHLHPLPLLALIDEIMGWGGFMLTASGSVTVKASFSFRRNIPVGQKLLVFGRGEKVRGSAASRLLYWASGGAAAVRDDGVLEPVVAASGQYMGVGVLTEQMRRELLPAELTRCAFQLAATAS